MKFKELKELVNLDFRVQLNRDLLFEKALELPFFDDVRELQTDRFERAILKMEKKYPILVSYIMRGAASENSCLSAMVKEVKEHRFLITIYALTIRELYLKICIFEWHYIQNKYKKGE